MSKYVENYWVKKFPCGIVQLQINTTDKWIYYHQYDDYRYEIRKYEDEYSSNLSSAEDSTLNLEPGCLQLEEGTKYIRTVQQDDDQISFYFIPIHLIYDNKKSHIIYESRKEK